MKGSGTEGAMAMQSRYGVDAMVEAGRADRQDPVVSVALDCQQMLWHSGSDGRFHPLSLGVCEVVAGEPRAAVPSQIEEGRVAWIARGRMAAGERRHYRIGFDAEDAPAMRSLGKPVFRD